MKSLIKCDWCGNICRNGTKHTGRNKHNFCCRDCYNAFREKKAKVSCEWCGSKFMKKNSDIRRSSHNFCSHTCAVNYRRWTGLSGKSPRVDGVPIHRIIAEEILGRPLTADEEVHHIDFNHYNNHPGNLAVISKSEHSAIHAAKKERDEFGRFVKKN